MVSERFRVESLGEHHKALRNAFSCGVVELDTYLRQQAGQDMRRNIAICWVLYDACNDAIAGYYTLSTGSVDPMDLPEDVVRKLPRYPAIPVMLVGRLALSADHEYRGRGLGGALLVNALRRALKLSESIGAIGVIVDAKDESARIFYERYGFQRFADNAFRLFIPMTTIERLTSSM